MSRVWSFLGIILTGIPLAMVIGIMIFNFYTHDLPDYTELANYNPAIVTRLYAADGKLLSEYAVQRRVYVPLKSIPKRVTQAFISAEDKSFYTNNGIDFTGIARAIRQNWHNLMSNNRSLSGGSTITQQVAKNFFLTNEKSLSRKVKEAILALRITEIYSKDRILELYLNEIYLGRGGYGVAEAAIDYFGKSLDELTIEEAAMLAAMPKEPSRIDPAKHYDFAKDRRDYVINRMMDDGYITADEARAAIATPIVLRTRDQTEMASGDFFAEEVRRELAAKYGADAVYKGGLFVKTTLDPDLQKYSDRALRYALAEYDYRHGYRGPIAHIALTGWQQELAAIETRKKIPLFDGQQLAVVLEENGGKAILGTTDGKKLPIDKMSVTWVAHKGLAVGDVVIAAPSTEKNQYSIRQIPEVNGAMIAMDPHTGRVLAMSGGYSYGGTEFNRATQAHRQPGSSFKPFVYLTAMENGYTPSTIVVDGPVELSQGAGMPIWRPVNYHDDYLGPATLRTGLEKSRNAMTVRLSQMLGLDKIIEVAERFGIYDTLPQQFSIVLGAQETTLIRLANAYCMLVNGGKKVSPWLIERIDDKNGKTILRRDSRVCQGCKIENRATSISPIPPMLPDDRAQIVDPRVAYQMVSMLEGVALHGTGARGHAVLKRPIAGKTGTTNDSRDTWFIGFSPDLVAGIYVGYDQPKTLGKKETGASVALPGFIDFMQQALKDVPPEPFRVPPGINFVNVVAKTGLPALPGDAGPFVLEAFKDGDIPGNQPSPPPEPLPWQKGGVAPAYNFPAETPAPENNPPVPPIAPAPGTDSPSPDAHWQPNTAPTTGGARYLPDSRYNNKRDSSEGTGALY